MARHHISDSRVQRLVDALTERFVQYGSVNALADALTAELQTGTLRIYPNRLHGLLAEDPSRSVNSATLEAIEAALRSVPRGEAADGSVDRRVAAAAALIPPNSTNPVAEIAAATGIPPAVVRRLTKSSSLPVQSVAAMPLSSPDWGWQDDAVNATLRALARRRNFKAGLVVPTGGGKTRIALRIALEWLARYGRTDAVVVWVTHRKRLRVQARRALQRLLREGVGLPDGAPLAFANQIEFVMLNDVEPTLRHTGDRLSLVIVDEAHHAAAPSYGEIVANSTAPALFLTATPNRTDGLPIGIDDVAYTITYRELFARRCLVDPVFEPPIDVTGLDWSDPDGLRDLSDYVLERSEADFNKVLVAVSTRERAEVLYESMASMLDERSGHRLSSDDVGFVHAERSSAGVSPEDFLDEFSARPNGVLIATAQFVGEGYDDPLIDAVIVTYPSTSISHLMQVAGRALRVTPGKSTAHVVQVRESSVEYHFDHRWLYQDISDQLRPHLIDRRFQSPTDLIDQVSTLLKQHRVPPKVSGRILEELEGADWRSGVQLMLTGIPYFGARDAFEQKAEWGALLVNSNERDRFVHIFNDVSSRTADIKEHGLYLARQAPPDSRAGSLWKSYIDLITAMEYARREVTGTPYAGTACRPYHRGRSTTWLRYVAFHFEAAVPNELETMLSDAVNRDAVVSQYLAEPGRWAAAAKVDLPLAGTFACLLEEAAADWLEAQRVDLAGRLRDCPGLAGLAALTDWTNTLDHSPAPPLLIAQMAQFTRPERHATHWLWLTSGLRRP